MSTALIHCITAASLKQHQLEIQSPRAHKEVEAEERVKEKGKLEFDSDPIRTGQLKAKVEEEKNLWL